ncbi:MAG: 50S ribosomal protein L13 [Parcubacteria group bacterium]|nr:50S ribosomal protein L13 [Parcubacteria group bacterium]
MKDFIYKMDYIIDAQNKTLGRLASEIALILQGKKNSDFEPRSAGKDRVFVKNIHKIKVSGRKAEQKIYYRHTGYMGHLKERKYKEVFGRSPAWVLRHAVRGMLPKNSLQDKRLNRLIVENEKAG